MKKILVTGWLIFAVALTSTFGQQTDREKNASEESPKTKTKTKSTQKKRRQAQRKTRKREVARFLKQFDKDANGKLDKSELPEALIDYLKSLDQNEDGELELKELEKMRGRPGRDGQIITGAARGERYDDKLKVGDPAPDFTLADPSGKHRTTLSSFRGKKPVVLIFGSYT